MRNIKQKPRYVITRLDKKHDKKLFSCGSITLDKYLQTQAGQDTKKNIAVAYVLTEGDDFQRILGYYTLSSIGIVAGELPEKVTEKLPKYSILPGILLGRLAVDEAFQGNQVGMYLLMDALKRSYQISEQIGIVAVIVDAINKKAGNFYKRYDFLEFPENNKKLFLLMTTIKTALTANSSHS